MIVLDRRALLKRAGAVGLGGLASMLPAGLLASCTRQGTPAPRAPGDSSRPATHHGFLVFSAHEAAVVEEATARLIPGPTDDPAEAGHPGAREANVTRYVDTMLGALSLDPPKVFAGGPFSNRAGSRVDDMATFLGLTTASAAGWKIRLARLRAVYTNGVADLDRLAGGSFLDASQAEKDTILAKNPEGFTAVLFAHAIEGTYSNPEYGGNADLSGWKEIAFPGDSQPRGYDDHEVSDSDGPEPYRPEGVGKRLLQLVAAAPS